MDDKTFQEHFGGQASPARRESTVLRPETSSPSTSLRRGAEQAAQTAKAVGDALAHKASPLPGQPNTGGPRYDRFRGKQVVK